MYLNAKAKIYLECKSKQCEVREKGPKYIEDNIKSEEGIIRERDGPIIYPSRHVTLIKSCPLDGQWIVHHQKG